MVSGSFLLLRDLVLQLFPKCGVAGGTAVDGVFGGSGGIQAVLEALGEVEVDADATLLKHFSGGCVAASALDFLELAHGCLVDGCVCGKCMWKEAWEGRSGIVTESYTS